MALCDFWLFWKLKRSLKVCIILSMVGIGCSCLTYIIYIINPVNMIIEYDIQMTRPSLLFSMWQKPSLNIYLDVYIFNISNSVEFLNGKEKLKVQEIGPYVYREYVTNNNITFNDNGTLTYVPRRTLVFVPEMSVGDPAEDIINAPNIPYLGVSSALSDFGFMLKFPFTQLANLLKAKPILNISVHDYLWGYEDSLVNLGNTVVPNFINFQKFGVLDRIYDEGENTVTIFNQNKADMLKEEGRFLSIDKYNGGPASTLWEYVETEDNETRKDRAVCDRLQGAMENVLFPPHIDKRTSFRVYRKGYCRPLLFEFKKEVWRDDGVPGYLYNLTDDFVDPPEQNPNNECFCRKRKICLKKGLYDATPCYYNFPIAISLPHFLDGDPSLVENVEGLKPDRGKHGVYMILQQRIGAPMSFHFRYQANLAMKRSHYTTKIAAFNDMTIPLVWFDLNLSSLPTYETILLKLAVQIGPVAQTVLMYLLGIIGATASVLSLISIVWLLIHQQQQEEITGNNDNFDLICVFISVLGIVCSCLTYIIYITDPMNMLLEYHLQMMPHSLLFSLWKKPPVGTYLNVYIFNITNPIEFLNGKEKFKVQEVGPYVYQEYLVNDNITYNDNGTLTYISRRTVVHVPEMSINDPTKDIINVPNIPYLGVSSDLSDAGFMLNYPFISLSNVMNIKPILNISVYDYLWGYNDPFAKLANAIMPNYVNFQKLGFLDRMYDEGENIVTIILQKKDDMLEEKGRYFSIDKYNGSPGLSQWGYIETEGNKTQKENTICNTLQGATEGLVFPTHLDKRATFRLYRKSLCRPISIKFKKEVWTNDGLPGYFYIFKDNFADPPNQNPDNECFCRKRKTCLKKGLLDITPCYYDMPVAASLPHFLDADPSLLENVEGLKPNREKHGSYVILQQRVGLPISFHGRFQVNLIMKRSRYNSKIAAFNDMTIPLMWLDLYVSSLPTYWTILLKMVLQILPVAQTVLMCLLGVIGATSVLLLISIVWLLTHQQQKEEEITGNNDNPDLRIPLCNDQYTSNILPIKKIVEDKLFDR